jgi:molybdopterin adenylyltransferase
VKCRLYDCCVNTLFRVGILTVSDRASAGEYEDRGGPAIEEWLTTAIASPWEPVAHLVPDDQQMIEAALRTLVDDEGCQLVFTTGGTGPAPRDITPEATLEVADRVLPGFGELMRAVSHHYVLTAALSRQLGVIRGQSLILNLPGNPKAIAQILDGAFGAVPDCVSLLDGPDIQVTDRVVGGTTSPGPLRS